MDDKQVEQPQPPAPAPAPEQPEEPIDFMAIIEQRPSRTAVGFTYLSAAVRGRISTRRSIRGREIRSDDLTWLLDIVKDRSINGPEASAARAETSLRNSSGHRNPTCACEACATYRAGRLKLGVFFGLLE